MELLFDKKHSEAKHYQSELLQYLERSNNYIVAYFSIERLKCITTFEANGRALVKLIISNVMKMIQLKFPNQPHLIYSMEGNEFVLIFDNPDPFVSHDFIRKGINEVVKDTEAPVELEVSIGITQSFFNMKNGQIVLNKAYYYMLFDKLKSRANNQINIGKQISFETACNHYQLERDLKLAFTNRELYTVFQPIIHKNGSIAFEALARWKSPKHGQVGPNEFIPIAERSLLIEKITEQIIRNTVSIINKHKEIKYITVNLSANVIANDNWLLNILDTIMAETKFERTALAFEITEQLTLTHKHWDSITAICSLGHSIFIDDFGTGQTGIDHLLNSSVNGVKLDRKFISEYMMENKRKFIVSTIDLLKALDLFVVIEGVEFQSQNQFIQTVNYDAVQGYLESPPIEEYLIPNYLESKLIIE
ncbi:EAL domain-containing protein [Viridibacillus sp. YIM B01967]|uniref:EAL domain-containing protein n=1 Tax=Viridibacillus soli TaxID=2798301 RepID=A0ABS1HA87_9BACL|nr:EAL domain-containing protein [Viridibacillus soli]MBK3496318.1 EAL domain-containing protein [Viridibacillus soli]